MSSRKETLRRLLKFEGPLEETCRELRSFPWDRDGEGIELIPTDVAAVLNRFLNGELSAHEVEAWANEVEGREDINFAAPDEALLKDVIFSLANPTLTEPLTVITAKSKLARLRRQAPRSSHQR